jgi:hypothetical protein
MKTARDAARALRAAGWTLDQPTGGHPHRAEIKAALALLRRLGVDVSTIDLTPPTFPLGGLVSPEPEAPVTEPTDVTPPDPEPPQGE